MKSQNPATSHFARTIFLGFLLSSFLTFLFILAARHLLTIGWIPTSILSALVMLVASALISLSLSRFLKNPLDAMHSELSELNQQVSSSSNALSEVSKQSQALLESLPVGLIIFDKKTQLTQMNQTAKKMLGFSGTGVASVTLNSETVLTTLKQLISTSASGDFTDWLNQTKTNKIQDTKLWPLGHLVVGEETKAYDIVAHYNKQDSNGLELVVALVERSEDYARQEKQMEFISLAAHELRGPITLMRGLIDVFKNEIGETLDDDHRELLTRMGVSAHQLAGYVDNILSVSRIDQKNFVVQPEKADWATILSQATLDLSIRAEANHRILELNVPQNLPPVAVDTTAIHHVINNLVDNAIKYSKAGGHIIISANVKGDTIETTVQDSGIGIPGSIVGGLFTKFYRSHRSKQLVSGTGLGLYLCKAIVEAHSGNIWVRSTEGVGTTFGFTLPTYSSIAAELEKRDNKDSGIVRGTHGWIKNHALYRR